MKEANTCKCGCGEVVQRRRKFVNKEHQLDWMIRGGASELARVSGKQAHESGRLYQAALKGGATAKAIAEKRRQQQGESS
jgi:hypothetical protein